MKIAIISLVTIAIVALGVVALQGNKADTNAPGLTFSSVQADVNGGSATLYDVRTEQEYASGHFENAINLPLQDIQAGTLPDVQKDKTIYVYCNSGNRSGQAKVLLADAGYTNVVDLGGLSDVQAIGGALVK